MSQYDHALLIDAGNTRVKFGLVPMTHATLMSSTVTPVESAHATLTSTSSTSAALSPVESTQATLTSTTSTPAASSPTLTCVGSQFDADALGVRHFALAHEALEEHLPEHLSALMAQAPAPWRVIGVNVAGQAVAQRLSHILRQCGVADAIEWLRSEPQLLHLHNSYHDVTQLGSDRWLAMLGASIHPQVKGTQRPALLVSFGTATTVDALHYNTFLGGIILPGLTLMNQSLAMGTAQLPAIEWRLGQRPDVFGQSTSAALESGMIGAQAAVVMRQWLGLVARFGRQPVVLCSGGAVQQVLPELEYLLTQQVQAHGFATMECYLFEDPVLAGLSYYAQHASDRGSVY